MHIDYSFRLAPNSMEQAMYIGSLFGGDNDIHFFLTMTDINLSHRINGVINSLHVTAEKLPNSPEEYLFRVHGHISEGFYSAILPSYLSGKCDHSYGLYSIPLRFEQSDEHDLIVIFEELDEESAIHIARLFEKSEEGRRIQIQFAGKPGMPSLRGHYKGEVLWGKRSTLIKRRRFLPKNWFCLLYTSPSPRDV